MLVLTWKLRYFWKRRNNRKGCVKIEDWGTSAYFVLRFQEILCKICQLFNCFLVVNGILKVLFSLIPWLLNFSDLPNYGSKSKKRYKLTLWWKCLVGSTLLPIRAKVPQPFDNLFDSLRWAPVSSALYLYSS